ncbi:MAG: O-antigen ligase family protein [Patescibacteria group bacterium]
MIYFIYFILFLTPTYLLRFNIFYIPTNALELMIIILFLIWIVKKLLLGNLFYNLKTEIINNKLLYIGIFLLFIGFILSLVKSNDVLSSLGIIKSWFVVPLLFYIVLKNVLKNEIEKKKAFFVFIFSGFAISAIGLIYFILDILTYDNRLQAFYPHPNMLSIIMAVSVIMIIGLRFEIRKLNIIKYSVFVLFLFSLVFNLITTKSSGAHIGAILAIYFMDFKNFIFNKKYANYILFGIIIFAGLVLPFASKLTNPWEMERNSIASRLMVWQSSVEIIKDNFILGIGPADFQNKYLEYQENFNPYLEWAVPHSHNIFISTWLMSGFIGFIGFILILFSIFKKIPNNKSQISSVIALTILIYLLVHGFVDNTIWKNDLSIIFWFLIALI